CLGLVSPAVPSQRRRTSSNRAGAENVWGTCGARPTSPPSSRRTPPAARPGAEVGPRRPARKVLGERAGRRANAGGHHAPLVAVARGARGGAAPRRPRRTHAMPGSAVRYTGTRAPTGTQPLLPFHSIRTGSPSLRTDTTVLYGIVSSPR